VYPYRWKWPNRLFHQAIVSSDGFASRAMNSKRPAAHDSLIILKRSGSHLTLVDAVTADDGLVPTGIKWKGTRALRSNFDRVRGWSDVAGSVRKPTRDAWETGLIATVGLERIPLVRGTANLWESQESIGPITKVAPGQ
jgi:hypothetical protein